MKRTAIFTLLFITLMAMFGLSSAHAQVGSAIVTAAANFATNTSDVITVKAQIVSCGNGQLPLYNNVPISLTPNQTVLAPFTATNTGLSQSISFTVPGNNAISCGGQNYSLYAITWYDNGFPLAPSQTFRFTDATTQSLYNLTPIAFIPPVIVNSAGALCPSATPVFSGFDQFYHIICGVAGSTASLPVAGIFQVAPLGPYTTIQAAVSAAGSTGTVWIMPSYAGTDAWINPKNIEVLDLRPLNPNNANPYAGGVLPSTTIKASAYGALCNGGNDDTTAINDAVQAAVSLNGADFQFQSLPLGPAVVELPQGTCLIRAPIVMHTYGSLQGDANGTWLVAADTYACNSFGCDMVQMDVPYQSTTSLLRTVGRFVRNINFQYESHTTAITGVHIFNQTGQTAATPWPAGFAGLTYQLPGIEVANNTFFAMDTGVKVDDCGECTVHHNQFRFVKNALMENGNDFSFTAHNNAFEVSGTEYTPTTGATTGFYAGGRQGFVCSNSNPNCSGGTTSAVEVFPQGCAESHDTMAGWDTDVSIPNCEGVTLDHNGYDFGSDGFVPSTPSSVVSIGSSVFDTVIVGNYIASTNCSAPNLEIGAPVTPGAGTSVETYNDLTISDNYILNYCTGTPVGSGIFFDASTFARRGVKLVDNTFFNLGYGIQAQHPVQYSVIRGNFATSLNASGAFINLNATGATSFGGTYIAENTTSSNNLVIFDNAGGGYQVGFNLGGSLTAPTQLTGTQVATHAGCAITAGAIGNTCLTAITFTTPYPDTNYSAVCSGSGGTGPWGTGDLSSVTSAGFSVRSVAYSTAATGSGTVVCNITHN